MEEGLTFKTPGHAHNESEYIWIISKYQPENFLFQYLVSTPNRYWTITIQCSTISDAMTKAEITYTYTGLNNFGNEINKSCTDEDTWPIPISS